METATIDHVVARIHGGTDAEDNLLTACRDCNFRKSLKEQPIIILKK